MHVHRQGIHPGCAPMHSLMYTVYVGFLIRCPTPVLLWLETANMHTTESLLSVPYIDPVMDAHIDINFSLH